ncbi:WD40-repeat-containing domain protein [Polychytrium aggregatum]|uniref:WD40-repeat-containing domain protein n=1 Tax=Polychytrium aggregatum TaxID=110093 RepID=UPI0022FF1D28|nr:WD40-repeat-containing domain protein [Polychytrium aggregatum]KAI9202096.1 WD40-repeat-containing domain protein [Polychytrium aggregatum]
MRLFNSSQTWLDDQDHSADPPILPVLSVREAECIYDCCWYPMMQSTDPSTCCFLSSSKDHPVRLWDAYTGELRATYCLYDHLDQITAPVSVAFSPDGTKIYCGLDSLIEIFDIHCPGRDSVKRPTTKPRRSREGQKGILSCISFCPDMSNLYAAGSFSGSIGFYDGNDNDRPLLLLKDSSHGITQVSFSPDGNYLYSASRSSTSILCWDIRNTEKVLYRISRNAQTSQRIGFSIDPGSSHLSTGDKEGRILTYKLGEAEPILVGSDKVHSDTVSAAAHHPYLPLLASSTGHRHYRIQSEVDPEHVPPPAANYVDIWRTPGTMPSYPTEHGQWDDSHNGANQYESDPSHTAADIDMDSVVCDAS